VIVGHVNSDREAIVSLVVQGLHGQAREIEAVVDTGFTGLLTLPPDLIAELGLPLRAQGRAVLGDGREVTFDIFKADVIWDGRAYPVDVDAAETPRGDGPAGRPGAVHPGLLRRQRFDPRALGILNLP
jgi:clan AA aspartic protease